MLTIIGTIKIDSDERRDFLTHNLASMRSIAHLLDWRLNVVGRHAKAVGQQIARACDNVILTHDDGTSTYELQRAQMDELDRGAYVFMWQEDHWFVCPHSALFNALLDKLQEIEADVLEVTHLTTSWNCKRLLPVMYEDAICTTYQVNLKAQEVLWDRYPPLYLCSIPAIYSWQFANDILELKREHMSKTTRPQFEMDPSWGRKFLSGGRSFVEIVPKCHIFREVFVNNQRRHSVDVSDALVWLALRDKVGMFGSDPLRYNSDHEDG